MKTRIIHTKLWKDGFFSELTAPEKLLFVYLLTNESMNILHIYECSDRTMMFDTGLTKPQLDVAKSKLEASGKMHFYQGYVYVKNADKYEDYEGGKYDKARETLKKQIGEEIINYFVAEIKLVRKGLETSSQLDIIHNTKDISHNTEDRVVKGKEISYLQNIPEEDVTAFYKKYEASQLQIKALGEKLALWCETEGEKKKNYRSFLQNRLLDQFGYRKHSMSWSPPVEIEITPEERERNLAKLADMKKALYGNIESKHI